MSTPPPSNTSDNNDKKAKSMKKFLIPILVLIAVLCLAGAAYTKKHSDAVKYAKAVATVKTKNKRLKTAYENKVSQ